MYQFAEILAIKRGMLQKTCKPIHHNLFPHFQQVEDNYFKIVIFNVIYIAILELEIW